ncbi:hypothetical protein JCM5350_000762 [Sporobolomyces pararoseus]
MLNPLAPEFIFTPSQQLTGPPQKPKRRDHLSTLPPELLDDIFDLAHSPESPLRFPLSRSLLPFWRARQFKEVKVKNYRHLGTLARDCSAATLALVRSFTFEVRPFKVGMLEGVNLVDDNKPLEEPVDRSSGLQDSILKRFFSRLTSLEELHIAGSSRLARLVLSPSVAVSSFPHLQALTIRSSFDYLADPFHPAHLSSIAFYTNFRILTICVERKASSVKPAKKAKPTLTLPYEVIPSFQLRGPLSVGDSVERLLHSFIAQNSLALDDSTPISEIPQRCEKFPFPLSNDLRALVISCQAIKGNPSSTTSFLSCLPKFPNLSCLGLSGSFSPIPQSFYETLQTLPLTHIEIGRNVAVSTAGLKTLVSGSTKIKSLEHLSLNNVYGRFGPQHPVERFLFGGGGGGGGEGISRGYEWLVPEWTESFEPNELFDLVELGDDEGIYVCGSSVQALAVQAQYERQLNLSRNVRIVEVSFDGHGRGNRRRGGRGRSRF